LHNPQPFTAALSGWQIDVIKWNFEWIKAALSAGKRSEANDPKAELEGPSFDAQLEKYLSY
jgi:hypothetical protein